MCFCIRLVALEKKKKKKTQQNKPSSSRFARKTCILLDNSWMGGTLGCTRWPDDFGDVSGIQQLLTSDCLSSSVIWWETWVSTKQAWSQSILVTSSPPVCRRPRVLLQSWHTHAAPAHKSADLAVSYIHASLSEGKPKFHFSFFSKASTLAAERPNLRFNIPHKEVLRTSELQAYKM